MNKFWDVLKGMSLRDWISLSIFVGGIIGLVFAFGSWQQSLQDNLKAYRQHAIIQDESIKQLTQAVKDENNKLGIMHDSMESVNSRLLLVEQWIKLDTVNQRYKR